MTVRYETLMLAAPEITAAETRSLEEQVDRIVKKFEGSVISFERWGKFHLAYPVQKNEYGVYFLSRFEIDRSHAAAALQELHSLFTVKFPQFIMRHMNKRLVTESLAYQRPDSLEETPTQDIDSMLRDNSMSGLLKSNDRRGRSYAPRHTQTQQPKTEELVEDKE